MESLFTKSLIMQACGRNRGTKGRGAKESLGPAAPEHYYPGSQRDKGGGEATAAWEEGRVLVEQVTWRR